MGKQDHFINEERSLGEVQVIRQNKPDKKQRLRFADIGLAINKREKGGNVSDDGEGNVK